MQPAWAAGSTLMYRIVGLTGHPSSGKQDVAAILVKKYGFTAYKMAQPLMDCLHHLFNIPREWFEDDELRATPFPTLGIEPSRLMNSLEAQWGRKLIAEDIWVKAAEARLYEMSGHGADPGFKVVIPRITYEDEADWVRKSGGVVMHVSKVGTSSDSAPRKPIEYIEGDVVIDNNRGKLWLYSQVEKAVALTERKWSA